MDFDCDNNNKATNTSSTSNDNIAAPIISFVDDCGDDANDLHDDKEPLVDQHITKPPPLQYTKKHTVDRSCMTSRETSDLENHIATINNYEISLQGQRRSGPNESKPKNTLVIGETYINWEKDPNLDFSDMSMSKSVAPSSSIGGVTGGENYGISTFEPRLIVRLDSGLTKLTVETTTKKQPQPTYVQQQQQQAQKPSFTSRLAVRFNKTSVGSIVESAPQQQLQQQPKETIVYSGEESRAAGGIENMLLEDNVVIGENGVPIVREQWTRKTEFLLAIIGFSVDLGNIWRFPKVVHENGGGEFLIPYFIQLIFCGLPLFYMELAIGQFHHTGLFTLWEKICPLFKGLAYTAIIIDLFMAMFYNTIIAWSVYYLFASFTSDLPWKYCDRSWNTHCCLPIQDINKFGYEQNKKDSFVYKVNRFDSGSAIRNRIAMFDTQNNKTLNFFKGVEEVYGLWNRTLRLSDSDAENWMANSSMAYQCEQDYECIVNQWIDSYYLVSPHDGSIRKLSPPLINFKPDALPRLAHDTGYLTSQIESFIDRMFANQSLDIFLNCTKWNTISPTEEYYNRYLISMHRSTGLEDLGGIKWSMVFCLFLVFLTVYFALWKGIKSAGKAVWITATAPYIVMFALMIRGITLKGSLDGLKFYLLVDDWSRLKDPKLWISAATQIFFSLGPGFGTIIALSSYNKTNNNCYKDALLTSFINCLTSILSGFVVFSTLGHMTYVQGKQVKDITDTGPGLIFITYPQAITLMTGSPIWSVLFFFMLFTLGIDSTFGGLEAVITGVCDVFPEKIGKRRSWFVFGLISVCFLCALPTVTYGGTYIVMLFDAFAVAPAVLIVVLFEIVSVMYIYGCDRFCSDIEMMIHSRPNLFWVICWKYISPALLLAMTAMVSLEMFSGPLIYGKYSYVGFGQFLSALIVTVPISFIPLYAVYRIYNTEGTLEERIRKLMKLNPRKKVTVVKENGDGAINMESMYNSRCVILNSNSTPQNAVLI